MASSALDLNRREYLLVALAAVYVLFRVVGFLGAEPKTFNDTGSYTLMLDNPVLSRDFLAGARAPTVPLLWKVVSGDDARIWANLVVSIGCWLALAASVAKSIRVPGVRIVSFAAVLLFALGPEIVIWDATLLSESLSVSLLAALVACWLQIARRPSAAAYGAMLAVAGLWALTRDPHAYLLLGLALVLAALTLAFRPRGEARLLPAGAAAGLVVIAVVSVMSANAGFARWVFPLQNVISLRIADDPDRLAWFADAGMPATPDVLEAMRVHRDEGTIVLDYPPARDDPDSLEAATPFGRWLRTEGRATYTRFMLTHPGYAITAFDHLGEALLDPRIAHYASESSPWDGGLPSAIVYPRSAWTVGLMAAAAVVAAAFAGLRFGAGREWLVPAFLIASSLPFAVFVYHGGALEPDRHGVIPSVMLHLGALILILFALDRALASRAQAPS